jgi:hypothetical protein
MTESHEPETTPPMGEAMPDEPLPEGAAPDVAGSASQKAREWLTQLEAMIQEMATQAAPVARQVGAKAAELAAVAAVKAGPLAHKAAEVTTDAGQKFAERAQAVAAELRAGGTSTSTTPVEPPPAEGNGSAPGA